MQRFMHVQIRKIEIDKWCEGCRIEQDPGRPYVAEWIRKNAHWFRSAWESSQCRSCRNWVECGHQALQRCMNYSPDE